MAEVCIVCQSSFTRNRRGNDARVCCSRACGFVLRRWRGEQSKAVTKAKREFAQWARRARFKKASTLRHCADCGTAIGKWQRRCSECWPHYNANALKLRRATFRSSDTGRASRRADKQRRKALQRGRIEGAERFDPLEILARDGWRCHICGISTPKRLRGTYNDKAPEIDHIIPLAKGGEHTRLNCACACRRCNIEKGSEVRGQLRLVA